MPCRISASTAAFSVAASELTRICAPYPARRGRPGTRASSPGPSSTGSRCRSAVPRALGAAGLGEALRAAGEAAARVVESGRREATTAGGVASGAVGAGAVVGARHVPERAGGDQAHRHAVREGRLGRGSRRTRGSAASRRAGERDAARAGRSSPASRSGGRHRSAWAPPPRSRGRPPRGAARRRRAHVMLELHPQAIEEPIEATADARRRHAHHRADLGGVEARGIAQSNEGPFLGLEPREHPAHVKRGRPTRRGRDRPAAPPRTRGGLPPSGAAGAGIWRASLAVTERSQGRTRS